MSQRIYIERAAAAYPLTRAILASMPARDVVEIEDRRQVVIDGEDPDAAARRSKRQLALTVNRGAFVKPFGQGECDAGQDYLIAHGANCPFDCEYCFLQGYFENAVPTIYVNVDDLCEELEAHLHEHEGQRPRYHAGEFCDALVFDGLTGLTRRLVPLFERHPGATLELRTKTAVRPPEGLEPVPNVVVSWTMTPVSIANCLERGAARAADRIQAARRWQAAGFSVGIRFDPIVRLAGWEAEYLALVGELAVQLDAAAIESVMLGCLRFSPNLAKIARTRGRGEIFVDELVPGADGKMRYFRPLREEVYRRVAQMVRHHLPGVPVDLCMESACVRRRMADVLH